MSNEELATYEAECKKEGIDDPFESTRESELSWSGKALDIILGTTSAFGPPIIYHIYRGMPLSWDSEFTGRHLLCMGIGIAIYLSVRGRITTPFMIETEQDIRQVSSEGAPSDEPSM